MRGANEKLVSLHCSLWILEIGSYFSADDELCILYSLKVLKTLLITSLGICKHIWICHISLYQKFLKIKEVQTFMLELIGPSSLVIFHSMRYYKKQIFSWEMRVWCGRIYLFVVGVCSVKPVITAVRRQAHS